MTIKASDLPAIGTPFEGGHFAGLFTLNGQQHALILAPKALANIEPARWGEFGQNVEGACSLIDGHANTLAMVAAGSELAQQVAALQVNGHADWYIPSRDELEILFRHFKPTTESNWTGRHGENFHSVPNTLGYQHDVPTLTTVAGFAEGEEHAFEDTWYASSTQYSPNSPWVQLFGDGFQGGGHKDGARRAVAVRRLPVAP